MQSFLFNDSSIIKMTLKNQRNHYNVKLLRGYGVSINVKDNQLILKNGQNDLSGQSEKEEWFVSKIPYEKIVISGKGYVSTEAISILNQNNSKLFGFVILYPSLLI